MSKKSLLDRKQRVWRITSPNGVLYVPLNPRHSEDITPLRDIAFWLSVPTSAKEGEYNLRFEVVMLTKEEVMNLPESEGI